MGHLIQIFEYEKLCANDKAYFSTDKIGKKVIDKLWQYNDSHDNIYFTAIRNGVKFTQYVGVIQIGNITIEILPKSDKLKSNEADKKNWHDVLLKMLSTCKKLRVDSVSEAALKKRYHSILDLYFEKYLQEVNYLIERGLVKKYRKKTGNLNALKGQLKFAQNIQRNLIHKEKFYASHQIYDSNHSLNQILYRGLQILKKITQNNFLIDGINRTLSIFPEVDQKQVNKHHFDSIVDNRKTTPYKEAIKIAKMIILNYSPDIKGGNENMIALLFDMNKLWEEYIYRTLLKQQNDDFKISFQNSKPFWENKRIKPDIVVNLKNSNGQSTTYVIDTKWKVIDSRKPSDDDLKQMYVYNNYWDSRHSLLLYPSTNQQQSRKGIYQLLINGEEHYCQLGFVNVIKGNSINESLFKDILDILF